MTKSELISVINAMMETMDTKTLNTVFHVILGIRGASAYQTKKIKTDCARKIHKDKK